MGRPAEFLPRQVSKYSQSWQEHFSGCARTRPIVKTQGLESTQLPDMSAWRDEPEQAPSVANSCARVRPYHRAVGSRTRLKHTGEKRVPVRQEVSKMVTRLRKFHCNTERPRSSRDQLTNVFTLTDEGLDDLEEYIASYLPARYKAKRCESKPRHSRRGRPAKNSTPAAAAAAQQTNEALMPKITVCRSSGETPLHRAAQQGWLELVGLIR